MATLAGDRDQRFSQPNAASHVAATPWARNDQSPQAGAGTQPSGSGAQLWFRFLVLNSACVAALVCAWYVGLVAMMLNADQTHLCVFISAIFVIGLGYCARCVWVVSREQGITDGSQYPPAALAARFLRETDNKDSTARQVALGTLRLEQSQQIQIVRHIANALVLLGLVGTVVGFIIALSAIDPELASDIEAITPMVTTLIQGMSTALYTTLIGAVLNIWLMANCQLLSSGVVKLITSLTRLGEARAAT